MLNNIILDYRNKNPKTSIMEMTEVFGMPFIELVDILKISMPKGNLKYYKGKGVQITDSEDRLIYHEDVNGKWTRYKFKRNGECEITKNY